MVRDVVDDEVAEVVTLVVAVVDSDDVRELVRLVLFVVDGVVVSVDDSLVV